MSISMLSLDLNDSSSCCLSASMQNRSGSITLSHAASSALIAGLRASVMTPDCLTLCLLHGISKAMLSDRFLVVLQYNYGTMLTSSHQFYRSQWIGTLPAGYDIPWRSNAFTTDVGPPTLDWGDMSGGIMEGREAGSTHHQACPNAQMIGYCAGLQS